MTVRNLARVCNQFEPSDQSLALDDLFSTREVAALAGIHVRTVWTRAKRRGIVSTWGQGGKYSYWTRRQVEQLRRAS